MCGSSGGHWYADLLRVSIALCSPLLELSVVILVLIEAFLRAYEEGNDIITVSIGGADGWSSSSTAVVASRIASAGRIVTLAAGNDVRGS